LRETRIFASRDAASSSKNRAIISASGAWNPRMIAELLLWGVAIAPIFAVLFAIRARIEERALVEGLLDYADYAARVRYRPVPGLW
jgi:protein-S-isoprenylcysteine O-methyltransferase Ste14